MSSDAVFLTQQAADENIIRCLLSVLGENPDRPGLVETPARVIKAWKEDWCSGYTVTDPASVLKAFDDGAENADEMVVQKDIEFYSHCEHHMAPFFGVAHVAYIPSGSIVGLSKLARLVDVFAKRLQVQERLTNQVADTLFSVFPKGVGVVTEAKHFCMCSRGVQKQNSVTVTSALRGAFKDEHDCRAEFLTLIGRR